MPGGRPPRALPPPPDRYCANCGKLLVRRPGERRDKFIGRKTCDLRCAGAAGRQTQIETYRKGRPPCVICGVNLCRTDKYGRLFLYCDRQECKVAFANREHLDPNHEIQWPMLTGEVDFGNGFAAHNITPGDDTPFRIPRPATHVETASSAAWAARE